MFGLAMVAPQVILIAIGDKWVNSIPLLQILCISGAFIPLYTVYQNLFLYCAIVAQNNSTDGPSQK